VSNDGSPRRHAVEVDASPSLPAGTLTRCALALGYVSVLGSGATMWRELENPWDVDNLALWQRPLANGTTAEPLMLAALGLVLLLIVRGVGRRDDLHGVAALAVLIAGALQALMGLGYWVVVFSLESRVLQTFGTQDRFGPRDVAQRTPYVTIALLTVVVAASLIRGQRDAEASAPIGIEA
jgi:hypothetical protein